MLAGSGGIARGFSGEELVGGGKITRAGGRRKITRGFSGGVRGEGRKLLVVLLTSSSYDTVNVQVIVRRGVQCVP